jgi:hypothetical protein
MYFIKNGKSVFEARKTAMFIYEICVIPVIAAQYLGAINMWLAVLVIGLAMAAHQAWSANIFTKAFSKLIFRLKIKTLFGFLNSNTFKRSQCCLCPYVFTTLKRLICYN